PGAVVRGHWCPVCSRDASKLGLDLMKNIALERGGACVSPSYHDGTIACSNSGFEQRVTATDGAATTSRGS
ncbi:hypothetical protein A8D80_36940, partial [Burkholderia cenocepacia]